MAAGGGAWKVAYADFVTAMMAFFMVMWLTSQNDGVKEAVAGYFREPFATYKSHQKGAAATAKPVLDPMYGHTAQPQKRRLAISGDVTDYQFTVLFPDGSADLEAEQLEAIRAFAPLMTGKLNRIEVRSHCIRSPLPTNSAFSDHWAMCFARCQRVREELQRLGIEPERIRLSQAEGNEPLAQNLTPEELKLNSRVDVILLPDLADIPWERRQGDEEASETTMEPLEAGESAESQAHEASEASGHEDHQSEASAEINQVDSLHGNGAEEGLHGAATPHGESHGGADSPHGDDANHEATSADRERSAHGADDAHAEAAPNHATHDGHGESIPPAELHVPQPH
jgi:chemotaxis protein MotB